MKVLLAIDGSKSSDAAETLLSRFPFPPNTQLRLVSVCPVPDLHALAPSVPEDVQQAVDACRKESQDLLERTAVRCSAWAASVETRLPDGHPAEELLKEIDRDPPDVAVLGARGVGGLARFLLGSISDQVARYAACPVLIVRPGQSPEVKSIVIADDGSPSAAAAVERVAGWRLGPDCSVHVVQGLERVKAHGVTDVWHSHEAAQVLREHAEAHMQEVVQRLAATGARVTTQVETSESPADLIEQAAAGQNADLIVVGSTGKSAWQRLLLGSVAQRVLHHAPCSVWIERGARKS